jgi:hypothetical protein
MSGPSDFGQAMLARPARNPEMAAKASEDEMSEASSLPKRAGTLAERPGPDLPAAEAAIQ